MENLKPLLKQHILTILAVLAIIAMLFPFVVVSSTTESAFGGEASSKFVVSGFKCMKKSILTTILIIGPVIIAIMNYVKPLEKYKGVLVIVVPIVCIISFVIVLFQIKGATLSAQGGFMEIKVSAMPGWGGIVALISYVGMAVAGAVTYHNFTLDKAGLEKLKTSGLSFAQNIQEKASDLAQNVSNQANSESKSTASNAQAPSSDNKVSTSTPIVQTRPSAKTNLGRSDEILEMIKKLSEMKDAGILTEEEFTEKKQKLLEEI